MTVIISSKFPAINIQQISFVIKAVFWKNMICLLAQVASVWTKSHNPTIAVDERKQQMWSTPFHCSQETQFSQFTSPDFNCCVGCIKKDNLSNVSCKTFGTILDLPMHESD